MTGDLDLNLHGHVPLLVVRKQFKSFDNSICYKRPHIPEMTLHDKKAVLSPVMLGLGLGLGLACQGLV